MTRAIIKQIFFEIENSSNWVNYNPSIDIGLN